MLAEIHPKLPMRDKAVTRDFYCNHLGFHILGSKDWDGYLMLKKDEVEIHFFEFKELDPKENYGQVYIRVEDIDQLHQSLVEKGVQIHPGGPLKNQPWGQREFSILDPDTNLLTFGQNISSEKNPTLY